MAGLMEVVIFCWRGCCGGGTQLEAGSKVEMEGVMS